MNFPFRITSYDQLVRDVERYQPERLVTLLDPKYPKPSFAVVPDHLHLSIEDITRDSTNPNGPQLRHLEMLRDFGNRQVFQSQRITLIGCFAGVSRSTAAALFLIAQRYGAQDLPKAVDWLGEHRPEADPNTLMLRLGDQVLGLSGSLDRAGRVIKARLRDATQSPFASMG